MKINSLGFLTNLIFSRFSGTVTDKGSYTVIKTPSNPGYHWGNYIIFDRPPREGDLQQWLQIFDSEFDNSRVSQHYLFAWENIKGEYQEFLNAGFEADAASVLTTKILNPPLNENNKIQIRKISTDKEWAQVLELQTLCADPKHINDYYHEFKAKLTAQYRKMSEANLGNWFGAFIGDKLVGDLGIFHENGIGRYQNVGTHPDFRKQGICGTLVYQAGLIALRDYKIQFLVMEADPDYHAARIYESVGFRRNEENYALSRWKKS